jgi:hypothetical protein
VLDREWKVESGKVDKQGLLCSSPQIKREAESSVQEISGSVKIKLEAIAAISSKH